MSSAIVRQWVILSMMPTRPRRIDTGAIEARLRARGIDVHRRTIQRDLNELAEVFPIVSDERDKPFGWRWSDEASLVGRLPPPDDAATIEVTVRIERRSLHTLLELVAQIESAEIVAPVGLRPPRT